MVTCFHSRGFLFFAEYATVGYMAKRIQMRKNRFQKIAESMKAASENPGPPRVPGDHGDHAPKQTVSSDGQIVVVPEFLSSMQNVVLSPRMTRRSRHTSAPLDDFTRFLSASRRSALSRYPDVLIMARLQIYA